MRNRKIKLKLHSRRRITWGFNPSSKVVPDKRAKIRKKLLKEIKNEY